MRPRIPLLLVSIMALVPPAQAAEPIPDRLVVLTFDDSSKSHCTVARPILKRLGFGATFFITEGFDFRDNKRDYMTWEEIAQLHRDGFEIGNHTLEHRTVTKGTLGDLAAQVRGLNARCREHGIPAPTSFAYPGNGIEVGALPILRDLGIRFARRGGGPEYPYKEGRGFAFEPGRDHPLLIPSAGDARPGWTLKDFRRAVEQARDGRVAVLQFHGVPDTAHEWVNTPRDLFEAFMNHLAEHKYKVIALRDLARYVDPEVVPKDPLAVIHERKARLSGDLLGPSDVAGQDAGVPAYTWGRVMAKAAFAPRDGAGALTFRGRMWLLGGWNPGDKQHFPWTCNNEVWSSADGKEWRCDKPNSFLDQTFDSTRDWEGRHTAGYVVHQGRMWIVGGDVNQGHYHFDVWSSADGKAWTWVNKGKPVPWGPRALHYTVVHDGKIWVMGGQTIPSIAREKESFYRDIWHTTDGVHWTQVKPEEPFWPQRGMIGGSAVFQGRIWVLGGGTYDTPNRPVRQFFNDVWSSADGVRWTRHLERAPWAARQYHEVAVFDGRLWVLEGYATTNRNDVWHSADGVTWHEVPNTPWKARHAASVFVHDNALWVVAGNNMESDVWKLTRKSR